MNTTPTIGGNGLHLRESRSTAQCRGALIALALAVGLLCATAGWADAAPLADALDNHTFAWTTEGDAPWLVQTAITHDGADAAQTGAIADNQTSVLRTEVTGPITVSFCWKASSQQDADFLQFNVDQPTLGDDAPLVRISGETDWSRYTASVPAGPHSLTWVYSKDASGSAGGDCAWVDQIIINGRACVDGRNTAGVADGTSWSCAFTTLQAAVDAMAAAIAPATPGSAPFMPEVWVVEGTYTSTAAQVLTMRTGVDLYGGFAGTESARAQRQWRQHPSMIDGQDARRCVVGADATIDGFRIQHGYVEGDDGPGMLNVYCSPVVRNCDFLYNYAMYEWGEWGDLVGGSAPAMVNFFSGVTVSECTFRGNHASRWDGSCTLDNIPDPARPAPSFTNCLFSWNSGGGTYHAVLLNLDTATSRIAVTNCTFTRNSLEPIIMAEHSIITNCIVWGNYGADAFLLRSRQSLTVLHSDIQGEYPEGEGNINADPLFADPGNGDFSLRTGSPCIDTGTSVGAPPRDILGIPRPQGAGVDIGAYERLLETSYIDGAQASWFEETQPLALTAVAPEFPDALYQWTKDGVAIPGATFDTFNIDALTTADSGWYSCILTDAGKYLITLPPVLIQVFPEDSLPAAGLAALLLTAGACLAAFRAMLRPGRARETRR